MPHANITNTSIKDFFSIFIFVIFSFFYIISKLFGCGFIIIFIIKLFIFSLILSISPMICFGFVLKVFKFFIKLFFPFLFSLFTSFLLNGFTCCRFRFFLSSFLFLTFFISRQFFNRASKRLSSTKKFFSFRI